MINYCFTVTLLFFLFALRACAILNYPDALTSRLEHLLVDTDGPFRGRFKDAITPCSNYVSGEQTLGRQTSAQWLRVAFHDFVTGHIVAGTGGMDASIGFETLRAEDSGSAFNDSFAYWAPFVDSHTSMADLIALGTVTSLANCGGLFVPYRGGRVDATSAGPLGVPEPETDLEETLAEFANAGFDAPDAIGLTACGHSLGRVHHGGFPQVVPESAVTPNNTAGGIDLDSTRTTFDIAIVNEYLSGYGQRGGPLVTSDNVTVRSDLRLYESDRNVTMRTLGQSKEYFSTTCNTLFERMINTVPRGVKLSDVIQPLAVKPINVTFDINYVKGTPAVTLSGYIRYLLKDSVSDPLSLHIDAEPGYTTTATPLPQAGGSVFGTTTFYRFTLALSPSRPLPTSLVVSSSSSFPKQTYPLGAAVFFIPSLSKLSSGTIAVAVSQNVSFTDHGRGTRGTFSQLTARVSYPVPQNGTLAPRIERVETPLSIWREGAVVDFGEYVIYEGTVTVPRGVDGQMVSVDVVDGLSGNVIDGYNHFQIG